MLGPTSPPRASTCLVSLVNKSTERGEGGDGGKRGKGGEGGSKLTNPFLNELNPSHP